MHIHTEVQAHACALPCPPCLCPGGVGELAQHPLKGTTSWKIWYDIFTFNWLHATFLNKKKKKKNYLFACLKRHKDNIHVCDPDCLWSRGREIVQTALPSSTPGCLPGNRAAVPEGRVRSPSLQLTLLAVPLVTTEEVNGTHRGLGLHSPTPVLLTYTAKMPVP